MRISTQRDALLAQLQTVTRVASTRSAVQALSGVQLARRRTGIELRATDMEIGLRVPLDGEVVREGAVVLPARLLVDVVRSLPGDAVTLELRTAEQDVEIVAGAATFHIRTLRAEDFPPFPEAEGDGRVAGARRRRSSRRSRKVAALGLARRDAAGPHRHPRLGDRRRAADGRDRLLPPVASRRRSSRRRSQGAFEANVPARALQELGRIVGQARGRRAERRACAPTRSSSRSAASCCRRG